MSRTICFAAEGGMQSSRQEEIIWPARFAFILVVFAEILPAALNTFLMLYLMFFAVAVWLSSWLSSGNKLPEQFVRLVWPLLIIIVIGGIHAAGHPVYDVIKDVWYIGNPALVLATGYLLMTVLKDLRPFFRAMIFAATIASIIHLARFALHPEYLGMAADKLREEAGLGSSSSIVGLALLIASWKAGYPIFRQHRWLAYCCFFLCAVSFMLSFSRTLTVELAVIVAILFEWISFRDKKRVTQLVVGALIIIGIIFSLPNHKASASPTFVDKILYSVQEIKIREYHSLKDINTHWRGYESSRWLKAYEKDKPLQYVTGTGLGTKVDLGLYMPLGGELIRFSPLAHNGYLFLLVKTGLAGLGLYLVLIGYLARTGIVNSRSLRADVQLSGILLLGFALIYLANTFVISGMFNKGGLVPISLLVGAMLAYPQVAASQLEHDVGNSFA